MGGYKIALLEDWKNTNEYTGRRIAMSAVMDIYNLIKDLMDEAEKNRNNELYSSLIDIW